METKMDPASAAPPQRESNHETHAKLLAAIAADFDAAPLLGAGHSRHPEPAQPAVVAAHEQVDPARVASRRHPLGPVSRL